VNTAQLRISIGAIIHSKKLSFAPEYVSMGHNHLAIANDKVVYTWQFQASFGCGGGPVDQIVPGRASQSKGCIYRLNPRDIQDS